MEKITQEMTEILMDRYGPFLSIAQLAEVLDRSANGLRISLSRDGELSRQLNVARKKVGRRVYFNVVSIAQIMTTKDAADVRQAARKRPAPQN